MPSASNRSFPEAAPHDVADAGTAGARVTLDAQALQRLRELDPGGSSRLLERVVGAFEVSVARLLPQLAAAHDAGDAAGIHHVAHTLKSSSASIGATRLSRLCADMEASARAGLVEGTDEKIVALSAEVAAALEALKLAVGARP